MPHLASFLSAILADLRLPEPEPASSFIPPAEYLWWFLPRGYLLTIAVETPVLLVALSGRHSLGRRLFAGIWLTACTYPVFILSLSQLLTPATSHFLYVVIGEIFVALAECALFWGAFGRPTGGVPGDAEHGGEKPGAATPAAGVTWRDYAAIVLANLASIAGGEMAHRWGWFER
jgi:hypothetical protein